jgi:hypothetical protein
LGETTTIKEGLAVHVLAKTDIFYQAIASVEIGGKDDMLELLPYVASGTAH